MKRVEKIHEAAKEYLCKSFSNSTMESFKAGARWADRTLLERAVDWLINESNEGRIDLRNYKEFEERFKKAMKE